MKLITEESKVTTKLRAGEGDCYFSDIVWNNYFLIPLLIALTLSSWSKSTSFHFQGLNILCKAPQKPYHKGEA